MDKFSYIYPQIENESQILYGINVKAPQIVTSQSALMTEVRDTVTQNVGDIEYKYQTIDYNNCSNILCEPLNDVSAGSKEIQTHYVQNYQHVQILEQIPQSSNSLQHTHIIQNFDGMTTLQEAGEQNKHSFEVYIQPPDDIFNGNEVKILEIDQLKEVGLQRTYEIQPNPIIHYTEYSQPIKKRRRIVQINDDESDEDPVRDEILKSISPQPPEEPSIVQESENERPKHKSKKVIQKILKDRQARALLQNSVIIPSALEMKRRKKRILVSDDDDDDIGTDLNDIGLTGNIQNNELIQRQNIILVAENSIDTQSQVPLENSILQQGGSYLFIQNENNDENSVDITKITNTPQYFINVEGGLHSQETYNVAYTIDNQNYTIKAENFTLKTENSEQAMAQIQIGDILTTDGQITKSDHDMMFNEEYMNMPQEEETEQENNQARDSGNSTDSMSANVVQSIPE